MTDIPPPPPPAQSWSAPAMPAAVTAAYASWGARLGAYLLDGVIGGLLAIPAIVTIMAGPKTLRACHVDSDGFITSDGANNALCRGPAGSTIAVAAVLAIVLGLGYWLWMARREGTTGQTIGKKALGIRTVDATTGAPIGMGRAIGRRLCYFISQLACYLGFLWPLWDARKQGFHDKIVSTVVVKA